MAPRMEWTVSVLVGPHRARAKVLLYISDDGEVILAPPVSVSGWVLPVTFDAEFCEALAQARDIANRQGRGLS